MQLNKTQGAQLGALRRPRGEVEGGAGREAQEGGGYGIFLADTRSYTRNQTHTL